MDHARAQALLADERARLQRLLRAGIGDPDALDQDGVGDEVDNADRRNVDETDAAVDELLRDRWAALERAEARLAAGDYGRSVLSGQPIPDERLEADPLAELTVGEAAAGEAGELEPSDDAAGLETAEHPFEVLNDADITPEEQAADDENYDEPEPRREPGIHIERDDQRR
jgi:RNA polymerase-binding transcription factor